MTIRYVKGISGAPWDASYPGWVGLIFFRFAAFCTRLPAALVVLAALVPGTLLAQNSVVRISRVADGHLLEKLEHRISLNWTDAQLRSSLANLASNQGFQLFLDRRVDPTQKIEFSAEQTPLGEILYRIADQTGCGIYWMDGLAYFGPAEAVGGLMVLRQRLLEEIAEWPTRERRRWMSNRPIEWPRLAQPNDLLGQQLKQLGLSRSECRLPHDLWPEGSLESVTALDRLIILVYGFERWLVIDESPSFQIGPVPDVGATRATIKLKTRKENERLPSLRRRFPEINFMVGRESIEFIAEPATLYAIQRTVEGQAWQMAERERVAQEHGLQRFSIRSKVPIGAVLKTVAERLSVRLDYDPTLFDRLNQRVELKVTRVTADELIEKALAGTGLQYSLTDEELRVWEE